MAAPLAAVLTPFFLSGALLLGCSANPAPSFEVPHQIEAPQQDAFSRAGMVVTAHPVATRVASEILRAGGNAADAAVAAAFAVAIVEPSMNGIGGRNQILIRTAEGKTSGIDATTEVPSSYDPLKALPALVGYPTIGVPGALAGLAFLHEKYGTTKWNVLLAPSIRLAESGFILLPGEAARQAAAADTVRDFPGSQEVFLDDAGQPFEAGDTFTQHDYARSLRRIARHGPSAFYEGRIARKMARDISSHGGWVDRASLAAYEARPAEIVRGSYRGFDLVGLGSPAAGMVAIVALQILETFPMAELDPPSWAIVVAEAIRLAFEDFDEFDGRPETLKRTLSKQHAQTRAAEIVLARPPVAVAHARAGELPAAESLAGQDRLMEPHGEGHTTHLTIVDGQGMAVAITQTLGLSLGSKVATPGLGFLYATTMGGYLGDVLPGQRAVSSISPFLVERDGKPLMVLGAAGGRRIPSAVVQAICRHLDQGLELPRSLAAPRVHPGSEGTILLETAPGGWDAATIEAIGVQGYLTEEIPRAGVFGRVHGVLVQGDGIVGAADPDWEGSAEAP